MYKEIFRSKQKTRQVPLSVTRRSNTININMQNNFRFRQAHALKNLVLFGLLIIASTLVFSAGALAQDSSTPHGDDISLFIGDMLPNQIDGVTNILPVFGGRYGFQTGLGTIEAGGANSHAQGVDFTTLDLSLRGEQPISQGVSGLIYGGADFNWYIPEGSSDRQTAWGFHLGVGGVMAVTDTLSLRGDIKFMAGPGTSLYFLLGVLFRTGSGT
jgi:hypothetical protein